MTVDSIFVNETIVTPEGKIGPNTGIAVDGEKIAAAWTVDRHDLHSWSTDTPYDGETFTGCVEMPVVRGEFVEESGYGAVIDVDT